MSPPLDPHFAPFGFTYSRCNTRNLPWAGKQPSKRPRLAYSRLIDVSLGVWGKTGNMAVTPPGCRGPRIHASTLHTYAFTYLHCKLLPLCSRFMSDLGCVKPTKFTLFQAATSQHRDDTVGPKHWKPTKPHTNQLTSNNVRVGQSRCRLLHTSGQGKS